MAASSKKGQTVQFNFDSLTDTVTNLSGTLILIVVLVLCLTREMLPPRHDDPAPPGVAGGKPIAPLLTKVEQIKSQIRSVDQDVRKLEARVPELQRRLQELQNKARRNGSKERTA
jgi:hypothetical protein